MQCAQVPKYDLVVIGGGSGGLACAKRAASYGKKVAVIEEKAYGGTCVNVGCVPKKIMYNASHIAEAIHDADQFGFVNVDKEKISFNWAAMKESRDRYIKRLNAIYESGLDKVHVERINGHGSLTGPGKVRVVSEGKETEIEAESILLATGGAPNALGVPGDEHVIDSDGFFALNYQPKKVGEKIEKKYVLIFSYVLISYFYFVLLFGKGNYCFYNIIFSVKKYRKYCKIILMMF